MRSLHLGRVRRFAVAIVVVLCAVEITRRLPLFNHATAALVLVALLELLAINVGYKEALVAAFVGAAALAYFLMPPYFRLEIVNPSDWLEFLVFLLVAITAIRLSAQVQAAAEEARKRAEEISKLYKLGQQLGIGENYLSTIERGLSAIASIFGVEGVAFHSFSTREITRAGRKGLLITNADLRDTPTDMVPRREAGPVVCLPVSGSSGPLGTIGFLEPPASVNLLEAIAGRFGTSLALAAAQEQTAEMAAVRRSQELGTVVLDSLAHEMKTPLAAINVAVGSLLSKREGIGPAHQGFLWVIQDEANRLNKTLGEILQMGHLEAGILHFDPETRAVEEIVASTLENMETGLAGRHVEIHIPRGTPPIHADLHLLKQALAQLVDNAVKYSPSGSPVCISAGQANGHVTIDVADRGIGISDSELEHVFEKYYRGKSAGNSPTGLGMGLAIARQIVHAHGGEIWATSSPGAGSVFHVSIPSSRESGP